jgi:uncharacterized protein YoaH (UPF0181 family)
VKKIIRITEKQAEAIKNIERYTSHRFIGISSKEATRFIARYRRESQRNAKRRTT